MIDAAIKHLHELCLHAMQEKRFVLSECECYGVLVRAGLAVPDHALLAANVEPKLPLSLRGAPAVLKVCSKDILHKSDVGGVAFLDDAATLTGDEIAKWLRSVKDAFIAKEGGMPDIRGALVMKRVAYDRSRPGTEVIAGLRWSRDFGFVGMIGLGGLKTELFGSRLPREEANALFDPTRPDEAMREIRKTLVYRDLAGLLRGSTKLVDDASWLRLLEFFAAVATALPPVGRPGEPGIVEMEFNPLLADGSGRLVPVDALVRLERGKAAPRPRPLHKLEQFFKPRTVAVAGVSGKGVNMGRIILRNLLHDGYTPDRLFVVKPGDETIDGVPCVKDMAALPGSVDLAVLAVAAGAVPELMDQITHLRKAETVIVIPGGMAEKETGVNLQKRLEDAVERSRSREGGGPLVCGPNSMGVASAAAPYDTTFIPLHKLPKSTGPLTNLAYLSQSGAFTITWISRLPALAPRYLVSAGNQMDLTIADYVHYVKDDPAVQVLAVYVEGFQPGDGRRFLDEARAAVEQGKTVVLYKGGRSPEGQGTAAGHTASIAGDYRVAWHLARAAGVIVTESLDEFEAQLRVATALASRPVRGRRVALMSNAGFETVAMADNLHGEGRELELAKIAPATVERMRASLATLKIDSIVDVHNPMDLTPTATDAIHVECARALLADENVDALVVAAVPLTPAMATLEKAANPAEQLDHVESISKGWPALLRETDKLVVAVIDSGALYDPLVRKLEEGGLPVFRSADNAVKALGTYVTAKLAARG